MIRLIALDIDGTLLDSEGRIPDANREAISRALDAGVEVALATGRRYDFARPIFESLPGPLTLILSNGAIVKVSSEFLRAGGQSTPVDYLMRKTGADWQVFDVMVEGVSFVQTFRTQFDAPLSQKSIPQVAADLRAGKLQADARQ